jgi:hypothetical protein
VSRLLEIAQELDARGVFTGGPIHYFEAAGRLQLVTLIREGIYPYSKVLDVGCGCLRGGYWLIHFLDPGRYFGIEPAAPMLQEGITHLIGPEVMKEKSPHFDNNDGFDFSIFGTKFDIVLARSIWSHTSKNQIASMLDQFLANSEKDAFFLTSYYPAGLLRNRDYKGELWRGRSHQSSKPAQVNHSFAWIKEQVGKRGLHVRELPDLVFNGQRWLKISRNSAVLWNRGYSFEG